MLHAVIDIGSNTIRLAVYDCSPEGSFSQILGRKISAGLAACTKDGELTQKGICAACDALLSFRTLLSYLSLESISVFATASLRNVTNSIAVCDAILHKTGYQVQILSGEEEARLDFLGVMLSSNVSDGLVIDIGGGSSELVYFSNRKIETAVSLPIGSLKLYAGFVEELFPDVEERQAIRAETLHRLETARLCAGRCKTVIGVGGTLRHSAKLCAAMEGGSADSFSTETFRQMLNTLLNEPKLAFEQLLHIAPERIHTLLPGMLLFDTISDYYRCEQVIISKYGVREGYLVDRIL